MLEIIGLQVNHGWIRAFKELSRSSDKGDMEAERRQRGRKHLPGAWRGRQPAGGRILNGRPVPASLLSIWSDSISCARAQGDLQLLDCWIIFFWSLSPLLRRKGWSQGGRQKDSGTVSRLRGREKDPAGTLSGGLQQMLAIGRGADGPAFAASLDEPSSGLAPLVVREIMLPWRT